jgi:hypothetical protein
MKGIVQAEKVDHSDKKSLIKKRYVERGRRVYAVTFSVAALHTI